MIWLVCLLAVFLNALLNDTEPTTECQVSRMPIASICHPETERWVICGFPLGFL